MNQLNHLLQSALVAHQNGQLDQAEQIYRSILSEQPDQADSLYLLGMLLHETQRNSQAIACLEKAQSHCRENADIHNGLCVALMAAGENEKAIAAVREAIRLNPDLLQAYENYLNLAERCDDDELRIEAIPAYLQLNPKRFDLLARLHQACLKLGRNERIVAACVKLLDHDPNCVPAHLILGLLFTSRIVPEQLQKVNLAEHRRLSHLGLGHLTRAVAIRRCAETLDAMGVGLLNVERQAEALDYFSEAMTLAPSMAKCFENRGRALLELGRREEAILDLRRSIAFNPLMMLARFELAKIESDSPDETELKKTIDLILQSDLTLEQRRWGWFSIGYQRERRGDFEGAFEAFLKANADKPKRNDTNGSSFSAKADQYIGVMTDLVNRSLPEGYSVEDESTIFIVGMPRSGTTLVERILGNHPEVLACGERFEISDIAHTLSRRLAVDEPYPICCKNLTSETCTQLGREYIEQLRSSGSSHTQSESRNATRRWTDKMPTNFWHLGLIACMLPSSRMVYVRRDPRDVALSCFKNNLTWPFSDLDAIGDYIAACERLMTHAADVLPIAIHTVQYETLVAQPEAESRRLIKFCGLSWNNACLQPPSGDRSVRTPSKSQVRRPFYQSSVGAWQRYANYLCKHVRWTKMPDTP